MSPEWNKQIHHVHLLYRAIEGDGASWYYSKMKYRKHSFCLALCPSCPFAKQLHQAPHSPWPPFPPRIPGKDLQLSADSGKSSVSAHQPELRIPSHNCSMIWTQKYTVGKASPIIPWHAKVTTVINNLLYVSKCWRIDFECSQYKECVSFQDERYPSSYWSVCMFTCAQISHRNL